MPFSFKINYTPSVAVALHHSVNRSFTDALRRLRRKMARAKERATPGRTFLLASNGCGPVLCLPLFIGFIELTMTIIELKVESHLFIIVSVFMLILK